MSTSPAGYANNRLNPDMASQEREPIGQTHEITIKTLFEAKYDLQRLLAKVEGSGLQSGEKTGEKTPARNMRLDADVMLQLAQDITNHVQRLHFLLGHDK